MIGPQTLNEYIRLFRGRGDCYGSWEGGCVKQPLTHDLFLQHLEGTQLIGVYPNVGHEVVWGCSDFDYDDPTDAISLVVALFSVGLRPWLERTRRGWHVWLFADTLVPAIDMRNAFLAAHQVINVHPKEVNPKQTELAHGQVGNYVRLPYPGGLTERRMMTIVATDTGHKPGVPFSLEDFVETAVTTRATAEAIAEVASYYTPPPPPTIQVREQLGDVGTAAAMLTPLGKIIYRDGPLEGRDRSSAITHLAYECQRAALSPSDALLVLQEADWRWGKYMSRGASGERELVKLVERVYGHTPSS